MTQQHFPSPRWIGSAPHAWDKVSTLPRGGEPRAVAQLGSAPDWGSGGRRFKSCQPDESLCRSEAWGVTISRDRATYVQQCLLGARRDRLVNGPARASSSARLALSCHRFNPSINHRITPVQSPFRGGSDSFGRPVSKNELVLDSRCGDAPENFGNSADAPQAPVVSSLRALGLIGTGCSGPSCARVNRLPAASCRPAWRR